MRRHENHIAAVPLRNIDNANIGCGFNAGDGIAGNADGSSGLFDSPEMLPCFALGALMKIPGRLDGDIGER